MCTEDTSRQNHDLKEVCSHESKQHLCHQCGQVHSQFFIKEHHCLMEILADFQASLSEQCSISNFQSRDPPLSNLFI
tara:strand:+ start:1741 stop:1971 length:231 start_codon:yes stop_codon:yes gene_type:complete